MNTISIDENRLSDINRFAADHERDIVRDIARLVSIPSVEGPAEPDAPFGIESKRALDCGLQIAEELGLAAVNCENKIGYASVGEDHGQGYLATITHLDVVPAGDGWSSDPFTLREREGFLLGRGVMDDKGPSVLCLYALKYLQDSGLPLRYPVRALLGSNEETGMGDLEYYNANYPAPLFCFSPDADFPLIHGEKGIYHARLISRHTPVNVLEMTGGVVANAVPAKASALVRAAMLQSSDTVSAEQHEPGLWKLSAEGISGHASMPEGTVNAIARIVDYLLENNIPAAEELPYFRFLAKLHASPLRKSCLISVSSQSCTPRPTEAGSDCRAPMNISRRSRRSEERSPPQTASSPRRSTAVTASPPAATQSPHASGKLPAARRRFRSTGITPPSISHWTTRPFRPAWTAITSSPVKTRIRLPSAAAPMPATSPTRPPSVPSIPSAPLPTSPARSTALMRPPVFPISWKR